MKTLSWKSQLGKTGLTYFFGYKTEFFSFQNNPKNLDPSYKMDLDLWGKTPIIAKFHRADLVTCRHSRERKPHLRAKEIWPRGFKTFFMLNSTEHEFFPADKC